MQEKTHSSTGYFTIGTAAIFLACFLLLIVFGAKSFRGISGARTDNMQTRTLAAYLSAMAKSRDYSGGIRLTESDEYGPVLLLSDGTGGYALHIYLYEGELLEDYAPENEAPSPERSQRIARTDVFRVTEDADGFTVLTDAGTVRLYSRSGRAVS